jgi:hypothetical protein
MKLLIIIFWLRVCVSVFLIPVWFCAFCDSPDNVTQGVDGWGEASPFRPVLTRVSR